MQSVDATTRQTIIRLLSNMGSNRQIRQYLRRFSDLDTARFALIKVGGAILRDDLHSLASALAFLQRVGLIPIVIHGGGPQLNAALEKAGITPNIVDGLRVTDAKVLKVARKVFVRENLRLVNALHELGVPATAIPNGVFEARLQDQEKLGLVGQVTAIHDDQILASVSRGAIPVLASLGESESGQLLNINADIAANQLAIQMQPEKVIFLTGTGGILDAHDKRISAIHLRSEYDELMQATWLHSGMRLKLQQIHDLLQQLPRSSSISITKPSQLARELFTHEGSGTLVRMGEAILHHRDWQALDVQKIRQLLESSFGHALTTDYFDQTQATHIYVTDDYRAIAIITRENGCDHLDKFAVDPGAQGEGLGQAVWHQVVTNHPQIYWRSRRNNAINTFYFQQSHGCCKRGPWVVFWRGITNFDMLKVCVDSAAQRPGTIGEPQ